MSLALPSFENIWFLLLQEFAAQEEGPVTALQKNVKQSEDIGLS
jgi:hypothetical protein